MLMQISYSRASWLNLAAVLVGAQVVCAQTAVNLNVSQSGSTGGDGSPSHPFATFEQARDALRTFKSTRGHVPATVTIHSGTYHRDRSFILSAEDSGSEVAPVIWKAADGAEVVVEAGTHLSPEMFKAVPPDDQRLAPEARGHVMWLDLHHLGLRHAGPYPLNFDNGGGIAELYFNGERMPISRWPNDGPAKMEKVVDKGLPTPEQSKRTGKFIAREARVSRWSVGSGVWLEGYWRVPWDNRTVKVAEINPQTREISLAASIAGGIGSKYAGPEGSGAEPWWAVNLLEEIDRPGEWSVDFTTGRLFWWPPENWKKGEVVLTDLGDPVLLVDKAEHVQIEGLTVLNGLSHGIELREARHVGVVGCKVQNVSGSGVVVQKGADNTVKSCDISNTGHSGIVLGGGDRATLTPAGHLAENNHIQKVGVLKRTYAPGILVGIFGAGDAVGCRVAHNFIHDVPHGGIQYGGNDNVFEYNEISHAVLTSDDMGAFYTTNDWTSCGNVLRYNFVHHSPHAVSFYMDDGDGGDTIFGNVSYEMQSGPSVCGGHYNVVRNNLVVGSKRGLFVDARGLSRNYDTSSPLYRKLKAVPFLDAAWVQKYPYLSSLPDSDTRVPMGNVVTGNVTVRCEQAVRIAAKPEDVRQSTIAKNVDLGERNPGFVDERHGDLRLLPESVVFTELPSFEVIPFEKIGLYLDAYRKSLPPRQLENP